MSCAGLLFAVTVYLNTKFKTSNSNSQHHLCHSLLLPSFLHDSTLIQLYNVKSQSVYQARKLSEICNGSSWQSRILSWAMTQIYHLFHKLANFLSAIICYIYWYINCWQLMFTQQQNLFGRRLWERRLSFFFLFFLKSSFFIYKFSSSARKADILAQTICLLYHFNPNCLVNAHFRDYFCRFDYLVYN